MLEVRTDSDTVWLNRQQLALLFGRDVKTIGKHIGNALREELADIPTVANFATVQTEGNRQVIRQIEHYNLDMILSIGYRVKSTEGVYFRRWATSVLREHLIQGYTINQKRMERLNKVLEIYARSAIPEIAGISGVLRQFTQGLDLLDSYDHQSVAKPKGKPGGGPLSYEEARTFIDSMIFGNESALFGKEKDDSFKSTLGAIYQTFGGQELYPGVQEKAANLLYLTVKNHSFPDANNRIAAALFVYFLDKNDALFAPSRRPLIDNNALAATTLMIALSRPEEKDIMCALVMNMLETRGDCL
jgi:prophage maintenance system killer protein